MKKNLFYLACLIMLSNATLGQSVELGVTPLLPLSKSTKISQENGLRVALTFSTEKKVSFIAGLNSNFYNYSISYKVTDSYGNYLETRQTELSSVYIGIPIGLRWYICKGLFNPYLQGVINSTIKVSENDVIEAANYLIGSNLEIGTRFSITENFKIGAGLGYTNQFKETYSELGGVNGSSVDVSIRVTYKIK